MFRRLFAFFILASVKTIGRIFFTFSVDYKDKAITDWSQVRVIAWINHTSLFDIFLISVVPYRFLWMAAKDCLTPIAEKTYRRPIVGFIFRNLTMSKSSVSQKRDDTWSQFLDSIHCDSIVALFPEGRMKRQNGLDKYGNPLSVKGGIADVLSRIDNGVMLIEYSGGMHHIQAPGQRFPRLFRTIRIRLETQDIQAYKAHVHDQDHDIFTSKVISDLTMRRDEALNEMST